MNNIDSSVNLNYSSFLGEKEDKEYEDLVYSLIKDSEFTEIYQEFKAKDKILLHFSSLENEKKIEVLIKCFFILKSQKDQVIKEYWKVQNEVDDKQKITISNLIEKYKNEAYMIKCERDELKIQLNNLKTKKDGKDKESDKIVIKYEKYKERALELEKILNKNESDKKEFEIKIKSEYLEQTNALKNLINQYKEINKKNIDLVEENEINKKRIEDFKNKLENLNNQFNDLTDKNIKLERIIKMSHNTNNNNFSSQLSNLEGGFVLNNLMMTELNAEDILTDNLPIQQTVTVKINSINQTIFNKQSLKKEDSGKKKESLIFHEEIFANKSKSKV